MEERCKKITLREDGFLEVNLKKVKDFDDYIYQQMQKDSGCLPCVRDHRNKSTLYYDTKGYLTLRAYMKSYTFSDKESLLFLIYVLENMIRVNTSKPIYMDLDYIFLSYDGGILRFLIIPVVVDQWVFQKEESRLFLKQLVDELRVVEGYEAIGYLSYMQRYEDITLPMILQGLHDVLEHKKEKVSFLERMLHMEKEDVYVVKDIPLPKSYPTMSTSPSIVMEEDVAYPITSHEDTRASTAHIQEHTLRLCDDIEQVYFREEKSGKRFDILHEVCTIGRGDDNDICIKESSISSHHAQFQLDTKELKDLTSSNGTFVNNKKIKKVKLKHQDRVCFAKEHFTFIVEAS